jgi:transposase InsO family protein
LVTFRSFADIVTYPSININYIFYLYFIQQKMKHDFTNQDEAYIIDTYRKNNVGAYKIYKYFKSKNINYTIKQIKETIKKDNITQAFQKPKSSKQKSSFIAARPGFQFQIDITFITHGKIDIPILTCIDVLTRFALAVKLKSKSSKEVSNAFEKIIKAIGSPKTVYHDEGKEFLNSDFQNLLNRYNIEQIIAKEHAAYIERFNRTLKDMLYKHFYRNSFLGFNQKVLNNYVNVYNNTYHNAIKMTPIEAIKDYRRAFTNTVNQSTFHMFPNENQFNVGDRIRYLRDRNLFSKSYEPSYTIKTYMIEKIDGEYLFVKGKDRAIHYKDAKHADVTQETDTEQNIEQEIETNKKQKKRNQLLKREDIKEENILPTRTRSQTKKNI